MHRVPVVSLLVAPALAGAALLPLTAAAQEPGRLVIVGGGLGRDTEAVFRAVLDARHGSGPLCIIPTASGDTDDAITSSIQRFDSYGGAGTAVGVPVTLDDPDAARDSAVVAQIRGCSGFWFTGGVQSRTVRVFRPDGRSTPAYEVLLERYREGAVVAGSSAGAAIMSDPMIAGGSTTGALQRGARRDRVELDEDENDDYAGGGVSITAGLGFLGSAIVDQHFLARGRIGRLVAAVLDLPEFDLGFGIDENTALVIDGDVAYTLGESGVIVVDARDATRDARSATGVRLHLLGTGDRFVIASRTFERAPGKQPLPHVLGTLHAPDNVFARWEFLHVLERFGRSDAPQLVLPVPGGELVLRKSPEFSARSPGGTGVQRTPAGLGITGLLLDVRR